MNPAFSAQEIQVQVRKTGKVLFRARQLEIEKGVWTLLTGPSGGGKTRCAEVIAGYPPPAGLQVQGEIHRNSGRSIIVRQNAHTLLHPQFRMARILKDIARSWKVPAAPFVHGIGAILASLGETPEAIPRIMQSREGALSGGEKQRLVLAVPLVLRPDLVILDEALSNLDSGRRDRVLGLYQRLVDTGTSVVLTSHRTPELPFSDARLLVIHQGQVIEEGKKELLEHKPRHEITRELLQWYI